MWYDSFMAKNNPPAQGGGKRNDSPNTGGRIDRNANNPAHGNKGGNQGGSSGSKGGNKK